MASLCATCGRLFCVTSGAEACSSHAAKPETNPRLPLVPLMNASASISRLFAESHAWLRSRATAIRRRAFHRLLPLCLVLGFGFGMPENAGATNATGAQEENSETPPAAAPREFGFEVSFPTEVRAQPATGRLLIFIATQPGREPRFANFFQLHPVYSVDVRELAPGQRLRVPLSAFAAPRARTFPSPLTWIGPGEYHVQALLDVDDTEPDYNRGPGNLYSHAAQLPLDVNRGGVVELQLDQVVPPPTPPDDTEWVKRFEIDSALLGAFHGRPTSLRAAVVLPPGYDDEPGRRYPVIYDIHGYFGYYHHAWSWIEGPDGKRWRAGETALRAIRVMLDANCRLGHHVFANSANNGPVGDALVRELIPEIERRYRAIPASTARFLTGHSSGGWSALWLQINYPDTFGGCWSTAPDPVDFRAFQTLDIYRERNGLWTDTGHPRPIMRSRTQILLNAPELHLWEYVTGYGGQLDSFDAVFGPRGDNGDPVPLIDKLGGAIDHDVAEHWKRYDIRLLLEQRWPELGPKLKSKLHVVGAAWDQFYLTRSTELLRDFLAGTGHGGYVEIHPGGHLGIYTDELVRRIDNEMAAAFASHHTE